MKGKCSGEAEKLIGLHLACQGVEGVLGSTRMSAVAQVKEHPCLHED